MGSKDFLGGGLKFPLQVDPKTGRVAMSYGEDSIRESIGIILRTYRGERVMRPFFGSSTPEYVFAPATHALVNTVAYELSRQLTLQEPRIENVSVTCEDTDGMDGQLTITVEYTVRSTNNRYNQVYPFYRNKDEEEAGT